MMVKAGLYARISLDRQDGEGVARQLADCRKLAKAKGWGVVEEFVDNDVSAFRAKKRPEFDRLLADLTSGRIDGVVTYHPDRLYRRLADLERFADAVKAAQADVLTVKAGDLDLSSASGRMVAGILGVANVTGATLRSVIEDNVVMEDTVLHTDAAGHFRALGKDMAAHEFVDHSSHEYVRGDVSTNMAESFFAQFKRSVDGTYHAVSRHHLNRYVNEFAFRWNTNKMTDHHRIEALVAGAVGKRLTYRPATGR